MKKDTITGDCDNGAGNALERRNRVRVCERESPRRSFFDAIKYNFENVTSGQPT